MNIDVAAELYFEINEGYSIELTNSIHMLNLALLQERTQHSQTVSSKLNETFKVAEEVAPLLGYGSTITCLFEHVILYSLGHTILFQVDESPLLEPILSEAFDDKITPQDMSYTAKVPIASLASHSRVVALASLNSVDKCIGKVEFNELMEALCAFCIQIQALIRLTGEEDVETVVRSVVNDYILYKTANQ